MEQDVNVCFQKAHQELEKMGTTLKLHEVIAQTAYNRLTSLSESLERLLTGHEVPTKSKRMCEVFVMAVDQFAMLRRKFATKNMIFRLASVRDMVEETEKLHKVMDSLVKLIPGCDTGVDWMAQLRADRLEQENKIEEEVSASSMMPITQRLKAIELVEALTLLKYEIDRHKQQNSTDHVEAMKQTFFAIVRSSKGRVSKIPEWFIPAYDVDYDTPIETCQRWIANTYYGTWQPHGQFELPDDQTIDVVIKCFEIEAEAVNVFSKEAETWYELNHPHILKLYGASHCSIPAFLVCEKATNDTLFEYLAKHQEEFWKKFHEAALGLLYLKEQKKMVHGNLKSGNILVASDGKVKLTDFGLGNVTLQNAALQVKSHPDIMWRAPECRVYDARPTFQSDVFSLGLCIMHAWSRTNPKDQWIDTKEKVKRSSEVGSSDNDIPTRPERMSDVAWQVVEKMCRRAPMERMELSEVVSSLEQLANMENERKTTSTHRQGSLQKLLAIIGRRGSDRESIPPK